MHGGDGRSVAAPIFEAIRTPTGVLSAGLLSLLLVFWLLGSSGTLAYFTATAVSATTTLSAAKQFAPLDISATAKPGGDITIAWSAMSWATAGYSVRVSTTGPGGTFNQIQLTASNVLTYTHTGLTNGQTYHYLIRGYSGFGGYGRDSSIVSAVADSTAPTVSSTTPSNGSTNQDYGVTVKMTFSEAMAQGQTLNNFNMVKCNNSSCTVPSAVMPSTKTWVSSTVISVYSSTTLAINTWYAMAIQGNSGGATDTAGNALSLSGCTNLIGNVCYYTFRTKSSGGGTSFPVIASSPSNASTGAPTNTLILLAFAGPSSGGSAQTDLENGFYLKKTSGSGSPCMLRGTDPGGSASNCTAPLGGNNFNWESPNYMRYDPFGGGVTNLQPSRSWAC